MTTSEECLSSHNPNMDSTKYKSPGLTYLPTYWCSIIDYHQGGVLELIQFSTYWLIILLSADRQRSAHGCTQAESIADAFPNRKQGPALFLKGFV